MAGHLAGAVLPTAAPLATLAGVQEISLWCAKIETEIMETKRRSMRAHLATYQESRMAREGPTARGEKEVSCKIRRGMGEQRNTLESTRMVSASTSPPTEARLGLEFVGMVKNRERYGGGGTPTPVRFNSGAGARLGL